MAEIKRWVVLKYNLDESDILWLNGLGCSYNTETKAPITMTHQGSLHTFSNLRSNRLQVLTTTDKQETMLKLKFGNDVMLATVVYLEYGETYEDSYGTIIGGQQ